MKLTIIESPFAAQTETELRTNIEYARKALADALSRNESPYASHLLYTQPGILDDNEPAQRLLGIHAGHRWMRVADQVVVYADLGISPGMEQGISAAKSYGLPVLYRQILGAHNARNSDS